jgi:two-component system, NarL family, nitrate/nitrite response regulator NarL
MSDPATASSAPMRVLIADDEPDIRLMLRLSLRRHDVDIVGEAADGQEVIDACETDPPDVVVLDLLMPNVNGFEVINELRESNPAIGIVAHTAVAGDVVRRQMAAHGIPIVLKTGDPAPLVQALRDACRRA